jgi:hypothetical protein
MNLKMFIKEALIDIIGAVEDAQANLKNGKVVPEVNKNYKSVETGISEIQAVEFDISVTADEKSGSEAKLNVVAAIVGGGVKGQSDASAGHVARLKFKIPIELPKSKQS